MSDDYEVGYRRPHKHTRFGKGHSGNPHGRPKGAKNLKTELEEELGERIEPREGRVRKRVSKQRAMLKSLTARAVQGDPRAAALILGMVYRLLHPGEAEAPEADLAAEDLAIIEAFRTKAAAGEAAGDTPPNAEEAPPDEEDPS